MSNSCLKIAVIACLAMMGCAESDKAEPGDASTTPSAFAANAEGNAVAAQVSVAPRPSNACGWIAREEVEAVIGPLAQPPRPVAGACRYTLPIPETVKAKRDNYVRTMQRLQALPGADSAPIRINEYALEIHVNVDGDIAGERGLAAAAQVMKSWSGDSSAAESTKPSGGWDYPESHGGRVGHVRIAVSKVANDLAVPRDKLDSLAVRVRNRIPDLPFAIHAEYSQGASRDPCVLLTRKEAEAVLGPLIVPPYRSGNSGPLAYPNGASCSYFTAGHHVLVITPRWSGGKSAVNASRGIAGIAGAVMNTEKEQSADTLEGPWDEAAMDLDGRLALLKGDRLLEIQYLMSSTDEAGALRLARAALERLTSSQ